MQIQSRLRSDFALGPAERADARSALILLAGSGLSLTEAARRALIAREGRAEALPRLAWPEAVRAFLAYTHGRGRRAATLAYYEAQFARFSASPWAEDWQRLTRAQLRAWIESMPQGPTMRAMMYRCLRAVYRWAARQEPPLVRANPTDGLAQDLDRGPVEIEAPAFYPVEVCAALARELGPACWPSLAVQLWAGLRPQEAVPRYAGKAGLEWGHCLLGEQILRVPAEAAKTRRARIIEGLPPTVWEWLACTPEDQRQGRLWRVTEQAWRARLVGALQRVGAKRIRDGLRHTFATYAVALTGDAGRVALWLGHEGGTGLLHRHYRGLATRAQGEAFFALRPPLREK